MRPTCFLDRCKQFCSDLTTKYPLTRRFHPAWQVTDNKKRKQNPAQQRGNTMSRKTLSRRQFVAATALSSAALITAPYIRGAHAAGKLTIGFWDHWVPGANKASTDLVNEWAEKAKVEVTVDYIPSQGNKNLLTIAAEGQAKSGHDIIAMPTWWAHANSEQLEPVNDIMGPIIAENGTVNARRAISASSTASGSAFPPASEARSRVPARAST